MIPLFSNGQVVTWHHPFLGLVLIFFSFMNLRIQQFGILIYWKWKTTGTYLKFYKDDYSETLLWYVDIYLFVIFFHDTCVFSCKYRNVEIFVRTLVSYYQFSREKFWKISTWTLLKVTLMIWKLSIMERIDAMSCRDFGGVRGDIPLSIYRKS